MVLACLLACVSLAQPLKFKWTGSLENADVRPGEATRILLRIDLDPGWHAYKIGQQGGPLGIELNLKDGPFESAGDPITPEPKKKFDKNFNVDVGYYDGSAVFALPVRLKEGIAGKQSAEIEIKTQICNDKGCDRPRTETIKVDFEAASGEVRTDRIAASDRVPDQPASSTETAPETGSEKPAETPAPMPSGSLWAIFITGFGSGILALITPCVFPMIPVTISFFSKQGGDRKSHVRAALLYCLGIVVSFTTLGMLVTILLGKNGTYILANNLFVNGGLFILFVVLAVSLFGAFELVLPSGMLTKITNSTSKSGAIIAPLLMGLTFALTSFTCTVPVVGGLLAGAAAGDRLYPIVGMVGFSSALALPFLALAMFPQLLQKLPKAGSWMVTAKIFMGFLELAAALKFLSNIDLVLKLGLITAPVFLAIWFTIFLLAGIHLWGWIRLPSEGAPKIGVVRRIFAVASVGMAMWCLAGINGADMKTVAALLPPDPYPGKTSTVSHKDELPWILNDYQKALAESKSSGKPLLIDFTGYT